MFPTSKNLEIAGIMRVKNLGLASSSTLKNQAFWGETNDGLAPLLATALLLKSMELNQEATI
ncbi:TPA: hypothetical protein ACVU5C_002153 [Vibrio parahaemolyticus]